MLVSRRRIDGYTFYFKMVYISYIANAIGRENLPFVVFINLDITDIRIGSVASIEFTINQRHETNVVIPRSTRLQGFYNVDIFVVVTGVLSRQRCGIVRMVGRVAVSNLCTLHIDLDDAKATEKISIDAVYTDALDSLVACNRLGIKVADIGDVAIGLY